MNYLPIKIWFIMAVTLALSATIIRLIWEILYITTTRSLVMIILLILATASIYAFLAYFTIKPGLKTLKSLPVRIWGTVMASVGLIGGIIHFTNFIPSPEAAPSLSTIIAVLFLLAGIIAYLLMLWVVWFVRRA
jgi:hypothetical protein